MDITLTLGELCTLIIAIALFILLLYCISLVRHLIPSIKSLAKVMQNLETITDSASNVSQNAEGVVNDVVDVTSSLVASVKGPTTFLGQASSVAGAIKALMELFSTDKSTKSKAKAGDDDESVILEADINPETTGESEDL